MIDKIKERFSDGIFKTAMVVKIKFLKSEIKEMKTHKEDDNQMGQIICQRTHPNLAKADF